MFFFFVVVVEKSNQNFIEIADEKYPLGLKLNYYWLRDHCKCEDCYDESKSRKKCNLLKVPLDIAMKHCEVKDEILSVTCKY